MATERTTERLPLTFERGVNEGLSESMLPDGASPLMRNWEPSPTGEARTRTGWLKGSTTSAPGTRKGVGVGYFSRVTVPGFVQASDVQSLINSGESPSGVNLTFPAPTIEGNLIVIVGGISDADGTGSTNTPSNYTSLAVSADTGNSPRMHVVYRADAPSTQTITINTFLVGAGDPTGVGWLQAFEFTGIALTSPLDVSTTNTASGTSLSTGTTGATAQPIEMAVAFVAQNESSGTPTAVFTNPSTGYNPIGDVVRVDGGARDITFQTYMKPTTATGTQTLSVTSSVSSAYAAIIGVFKAWYTGSSTTSATSFLVANNDTTEYDFWALDRANLGAGTWANEGSIAVSDPTQHVAMAPGLGRTWITNPQFGSIYVYDGETVEAVSGSPPGRTVAVHKNRVWVAGTNASPGRLHFSNIGNGLTWDTLDYIDVAAEDGEPIEDITPMGELLVIGKRTGLWLLAGSGLDSFDLQRTSTGGLAPGRTLSPTPYGTIAVGRAFIWIVDPTGAVEKISFPVSSSFMYSSGFFTTAYVDNAVYICDPTQFKIFVFNLQTGTWREENVHNTSSTESPAVVGNHDNTMVYAPINGSTGSLLNYRNFPSATSRSKDFDTLTEKFALNTREILPVGPDEACTPRHLYLRIRQHGGNASDPGIVVTPQYRELDGSRTNGAAHTITPKSSAAVFRERIDLGHLQGVSGIRFTFEQTLQDGDDATMDIEEAILEFDVERIR